MNSTVIMTAEMKRMAWHFAKAISVDEYKCDNRDLATRFYKGILGEMAVCQLLFGDYKLADINNCINDDLPDPYSETIPITFASSLIAFLILLTS